MPSNFPTQLDALINPSASSKLNDPAVAHHKQHSNANDAIEAIQNKVGINDSTDITSLDYKVRSLQVRPITLGGDITGTGVTVITSTLNNVGVIPGNYGSPETYLHLTVDAKGRVIDVQENSMPTGLKLAVKTINVNTVLTTNDYYVKCDATSESLVLTLPPIIDAVGQSFVIAKHDLSINTIEIKSSSNDSLYILDTVTRKINIICDGYNWEILN
jgi:hypothetical protein